MPPLKRHIALQPLSREHHKLLILSQLLKQDVPNYKGLPITLEGKVAYTRQSFEQRLAPHFEWEEQRLIPTIRGYHVELDTLCNSIEQEHHAIRKGVAGLANADADTLDALGRLLETHVRREERIWFELIQQIVPESVLQELIP